MSSLTTINSNNQFNSYYLINQDAINLVHKFLPVKREQKVYFEGRRVETYNDITENLTLDQKQALEDKLNSLPDQESVLNKVCEALSEGEIQDSPIENFSLYCLLALREQLIDGLTYSTSQLFLNVLNRLVDKNKAEVVPLFYDDDINRRAWKLIEETLKPFPRTQYRNEIIKSNEYDPYPRMTSEQLTIFFDLMRTLPSLEQQFILIPDPNPIGKTKTPVRTVSFEINDLIHRPNVLCRVSDKEEEPKRMIPSKGIFQAYLIAKHGKYAPTLISSYGLSPVNVLKNGIPKRERPFCLDPTPELVQLLPLVRKADLVLCDFRVNECPYHDVYHGDLFGDARDDQMKFYAVGEICEDLAKKNAEVFESANTIAEQMYDMQHLAYTEFGKITLPASDRAAPFWLSIVRWLPEKDRYAKDQIITEIFNKLIDQSDSFKEKYDLTLESLIQVNYSNYFWSLTSHTPLNFTSHTPLNHSEHVNSTRFRSLAISTLENRFKGKKFEELIQLSEHPASYLLRQKSLEELRKPMDKTNSGTFISLSQKSSYK